MSLALRAARRHVHTFADECEIQKNQRDVDDCLDCEAFLQLGIDAFRWLIRADEAHRKGVFSGQDYDAEFDRVIQELFRLWLKPCVYADELVTALQARGCELTNLAEFRRCEREVLAIVRALEDASLTEPMQQLRDSAVTEHRNGETAEFV